MKRPVLVRTLPLNNGNYGGVLQAYALQESLRRIGLDVVTDSSRNDRPQRPAQFLRGAVKSRVAELPFVENVVPQAWHRESVRRTLAAPTDRFVRKNVRTVEVFRGRALATDIGQFGAFVTGSDQVWRHAYGDVSSYMFDFVPPGGAPIFSYAASFGLDTVADYPTKARETARRLLSQFSAVSVRERSAVEICQEVFGVVAEQHIDPTLLLTSADYHAMAPPAVTTEPFMLSYVLDTRAESQFATRRLSSKLGLRHVALMEGTPTRARDASRVVHARPSVETWLRAFADCECVVTDSFHGTVFAIANNKPFVCIANAGRGATRFDSLLELVGLRGRILEKSDDLEDQMAAPVDWLAVNAVLDTERERALTFLRKLQIDPQ